MSPTDLTEWQVAKEMIALGNTDGVLPEAVGGV